MDFRATWWLSVGAVRWLEGVGTKGDEGDDGDVYCGFCDSKGLAPGANVVLAACLKSSIALLGWNWNQGRCCVELDCDLVVPLGRI